MKKIIFFFLLFSMFTFGQTGLFNEIKVSGATENNSVERVVVQDPITKKYHWVLKSSLIPFTINDNINDGVVNAAPSQNAVYDALSNKVNKTGDETIIDTKTFIGKVNIQGTNAASNSNAIAPFSVMGGNGGNSTATTGFAVAGNAGEIKIQGGNGGNALSSTDTNLGGTAGAVYLVGGDGGLAIGGSTNLPGNGGNATLQGGDSWGGVPGFASLKAGNNKVSGGYGSSVYIVPGWGNNSDNDDDYNGTIFLGLSPNTVSVRGNTVVGGTTDDTTNRLQVNGSTKSTQGFNSTWTSGSLLAGTLYSGTNRKFSFNSTGDGVIIPSTHSVEVTAQPDSPLILRRTTDLGNNFLEIDDYTVFATNTAIEMASASGLANTYLNENGVGFSTDGINKVYVRTDNLTNDRFLQAPDVSGTLAVKGDISLQDILSVNGESYTGSFPDALGVRLKPDGTFIQQQTTHPLESTNYVTNLVDLYNDSSVSLNLKFTKGDIATTTQIQEASIKLNENGVGVKTTLSGNHAYFRTDNLTGIGDKTYQMPDVSGGTFLTTKGTTNSFPIEGNIQFADGEHDFEIYNTNNDELNYRGSLFFGGSGISLNSQNSEANSSMQLQPGALTLTFSNTNSRGIIGQEDYSFNIMDTDFTQKIYVDKNRLKEYTVATLPLGTLGDTAFVTDALSPTYLGTLTGGGSVKVPVFYNGTSWVAH